MRVWKKQKPSPVYRRNPWPSGPWDNEPDKALWVYEGLDCQIVRNPTGSLCGYVGIPKGHPLFGRDYDELYRDGIDLDCHGGLTFAGLCSTPTEERPETDCICLIPEEGSDRSSVVWWFGFDCAHAGDVSPWMMAQVYNDPFLKNAFKGDIYRNFEFVKAEVERLARQLVLLAETAPKQS